MNKELFNQACEKQQEILAGRITMKARTNRQRRCRIIREYFGLTVEELAKLIDVSEKTIYRYETGKFKRNTDEIIKCSVWYTESWMQMIEEGHNFLEVNND